MANSSLQVLNRASIFLTVVLFVVPTVICQMPLCRFKAVGRHPDEKMMKMFTTRLVNELQINQDTISESTHDYLQNLDNGTDLENFFNIWHESHEIPWMRGYLDWNFQDRPDIQRVPARVRQLYIPFNRIFHYLNHTENDKISTNTVESTQTMLVNEIRSKIKKSLRSGLCSMYKYLATEDSNLHIESLNEIELPDSDKENIVSGLLYVYLTKALEQFLNWTKLFAKS